MPTVMLPMNPAPATAVAGACKIATEFPPNVLIVAMSMAIVSAIDPHVPPTAPVMPRDAVTSRCARMATVLGLADAPLAVLVGGGGRGLDFLGSGWRRCRRHCRCCGHILFARVRLALGHSGRCGEHNQ
jgi:hypothetical protein